MVKSNQIPTIRFKGYTEEWEQKKLKEVSWFQEGPGLRNWQFTDKGIKVINVTNLEYGFLNLSRTHRYISDFEYNKMYKHFSIDENDIVIASSGNSYGKVSIVRRQDLPLLMNTSVIRFKAINGLDFEYLITFLKSYHFKFQIDILITGGAQPNFGPFHLNKIQISVPKSRPEQTQIGNYFKELDTLIQSQEQKLEKVINLKKAMLEKMFPRENADFPEIRFKGFSEKWENKKLGQVGTVLMNKRIFKYQTKEVGEIPFYKIGTFGSEPDAFISRAIFEEYKGKYPYPEKGDILISASGSIGRIVEYLGADEYFQDSNIVWLKNDGSVLNVFLKHFYSIVKWNGLEGSTIKRLYNSNILNTYISLPSIEEQQKIAAFFQNLDQLISQSQQKIRQLKNVKQALLQKMFL